MKEYIVRYKMNKGDDTFQECRIKAYYMETRIFGAAFFDDEHKMIAYFPYVHIVYENSVMLPRIR